jgi:hypothetical protein
MLLLQTCGRDVPIVFGGDFRGGRPGGDAARAAVEGNPCRRYIIDHGTVIYVTNIHRVDVIHGAVIEEISPLPIAALIPYARITEAVIDSTVEPDVRAPVSRVP